MRYYYDNNQREIHCLKSYKYDTEYKWIKFSTQKARKSQTDPKERDNKGKNINQCIII